MNREAQLVELVDESGTAVGDSTVDEAHRPPGRLHRAFSVVLLDPDDRVLLQQRSADKTRFPLRWGNSCCGHPGPGTPVSDAAGPRLTEELGVAAVPFTEVGVYRYRAIDPVSGRVENEYDHVLVGRVPADLRLAPDPAEVAATRWAPLSGLVAELDTAPKVYVPWLRGVLTQLLNGNVSR